MNGGGERFLTYRLRDGAAAEVADHCLRGPCPVNWPCYLFPPWACILKGLPQVRLRCPPVSPDKGLLTGPKEE
jgi:hypothetical protein